jgi:hypothetical protein
MNPALRAERLERERRLDPSRFAREYEAEFADDLEAFLPSAWVDQAVVPGRHVRAGRTSQAVTCHTLPTPLSLPM